MTMAIALPLAVQTTAWAAPIRNTANLVSVTIFEATFGVVGTTYAPNAPQITARRAGPLTSTNFDFSFFAGEYYDVFYSDAAGAPDANGSYVTVEGVWPAPGQNSGGFNIAEIRLNFAGNVTDFADFVASFAYGSVCSGAPTCLVGSENLAVDQNLSTFPRFGFTSPTNPNERFRLTAGFNGISDLAEVPEPAPFLLAAAGLGAIGLLRRRKA
ncbi:MAG TPA: hypothetical protein DEH78_04350 [Solibacterales bacterium]|nr:hypothetical protein [Bryobacterales bacterium]